MADQFTYQRGDLSITPGTNSAYNNATAGNGGGGGSANNSSGGSSSNSTFTGGSSSSNTTITTTKYKAVVIKENDGNVYGVINPGDSPSIELQFTFPIEKPNEGETTFGTEIGIEADVFNGSAIKYITEF